MKISIKQSNVIRTEIGGINYTFATYIDTYFSYECKQEQVNYSSMQNETHNIDLRIDNNMILCRYKYIDGNRLVLKNKILILCV